MLLDRICDFTCEINDSTITIDGIDNFTGKIVDSIVITMEINDHYEIINSINESLILPVKIVESMILQVKLSIPIIICNGNQKR